MKHKHSEVIKAFVDGIECEYFSIGGDRWVQFFDLAVFSCDVNVRIKPKPLKEEEPQYQEPQYLYVYNHTTEGKTYMFPTFMQETQTAWHYLGKVRVEK